MKTYHKIQTVYKRDPETRMRTLLEGDYSLPEFAYLKDCQWEFTEKVDGTNIRIEWNGETVVMSGRTDDSQIPSMLVQSLNEIFEGTANKQKLATVFPDATKDNVVTLFGEGYGNKIQKVGKLYKNDGTDFVLFDVNAYGWWLERENVDDVAKKLDIRSVPIIGHGTLDEMVERTREGFKSQWGDFTAEGIVARPTVELRMRNAERIITKIKHKDFQS